MSIIDFTLDRWKSTRKTKLAPSGFVSGNAPCCQYRGQNPDKRGRGGMIVSGNTLSFSCFNCNFKCSYQIGKPLYPKFINLLKWLNVDEKTISQLKLESLREANENTSTQSIIKRRDIKPVDLPNNCELLDDDRKHQAHIDFLKSRGFTVNDFPFLYSPDMIYRSRIILPFILHDTIIGYSARSIVTAEKTRYIMKMTTDFVFGLENVKPEHNIVFVMEGLFDALSIKGLAVMHDEISDAQVEMICDLQKNIIVVPDLDKTGVGKLKILKNGGAVEDGNGLINMAIDNEWSVAFPEWEFKDVNEAYVKYGPLFCVKHLIDTATNNSTLIRLKQLQQVNRFK